MSFSGTVKEELLKHVPAARHCQIAELAAILHFCGHYEGQQETAESTAGAEENLGFVQNAEKNSKNTVKLFVQAENETVIRKCFTLLKKTFNINTSVMSHFQKKSREDLLPAAFCWMTRRRSGRCFRP